MKNLLFSLVVIIPIAIGSCSSSNSGFISNKENLSVQEALKLANEGALIVDVRERDEVADEAYDVKNILNIPVDSIENRMNEIPKDKQIILACRSGRRSDIAYDFLKEKGFTNLSKMDGGIIAWVEAGQPTIEKQDSSAPSCCSGTAQSNCKKDENGKCIKDNKSCCSGTDKSDCKKDENGKCIPSEKSSCSAADSAKCASGEKNKCCSK